MRLNKVEISGIDTSELKTMSEEKKKELLRKTRKLKEKKAARHMNRKFQKSRT